MSLDVAYSVEADDFVDPDRAYDLYWSGVIMPAVRCATNS